MNAISSFGFRIPILVDCSGVIIDGVVRFEAAKTLELPSVPCIVCGDLNAAERKALRLAVNRLGEKGTWDLDLLKCEFEELIIEDVPLEMSGFDLVEIDGILSFKPDLHEKGPLKPRGDAVAKLGDVFRLGPHRVICGDARDAKTLNLLMGDELATLVFTDQPYNVPIAGHVTKGDHRDFAMAAGEMSAAEFKAFNLDWIARATHHLKDGGLLCTYIDWRGLVSVSNAALELGLEQINLIAWTKTNAGMGSLYRSQHEMLPLFRKGRAGHINNVQLGKTGRWRSNVWSYAGASSLGSEARKGLVEHPTVKPTAMLVDAMFDLTNRGDIVLDPFLGSGSTLIAAEKAGRVCRGIEIDPRYVDVILRRYKEETGKSAILVETGEAFEALEERRLAPGAATVKNPVVADEPAVVRTPSEEGAEIPKVRVRIRPAKPASE